MNILKRNDLDLILKDYLDKNSHLTINNKELKANINNLISIDDQISSQITNKNHFNSLCLSYRVEQNMCFSDNLNKRKAIESHTVANNQLKQLLDDNNQLIEARVSMGSLLKNKHPTSVRNIGVAKASTFVGFCNSGKDSCEDKFKRIDDINNFPLIFDDYLMFLYRDLGKRIACMETTINVYTENLTKFKLTEDFFKFSVPDFSFDKWIQDLKYQLIDTKSTFMFINGRIHNKIPFYGIGPNCFKIQNIKIDIEGFAIGTCLRNINEGFKDLGVFKNLIHYHFWIDKENKQRIQLFYPNKPFLENFFKKTGNKTRFFILLCMAIVDSFPNIFLKKNDYIDINNLMSEIYSKNITNTLEPEKIVQFMEHLKKKKIITNSH